MLWKIMRPRWWLVRRQFARLTGRRRMMAAGVAVLALAGVGWLFDRLVKWLAGPAGDAALLAFVPGALSGILFFVFIQLGDILGQFYLSPDLAYLQSAPVTRSQLFAARLLTSTQASWLPAGAAALILTALGVAHRAPAGYYVSALALTIAFAGLATAVGVALVIGIAGLLPPTRLRRWLPAALALASLGSLLLHQAAFSRLAGWEPVVRLLTRGLLEPGRLAVAALAGLAAALVMMGVDWWLFATVYARTVNSLGTVSAAPRTGRRQPVTARLARALAAAFPPGQRHIVTKEWLCLLRDPQQIMNLWLVPLLMAVLLLPMLSNREGGGGLRVLSFWLLLVYATLFGLNASQGAALPAFLLEGRRLMLLRQTGVGMRAALWAKFWAAYLPTVLAWAVVLAAYGLFLGIDVWQIAWLALTVAAGLLGACAIMLAAGALGADYSVTVVRPKPTGQAMGWSWLGLLVGAVWEVACLALSAWLLLVVGQGTPVVETTEVVLSVVPPLGRALNPAAGWLPAAALGALGGVGLAIVWLWRAARRRLETWEPAAAS